MMDTTITIIKKTTTALNYSTFSTQVVLTARCSFCISVFRYSSETFDLLNWTSDYGKFDSFVVTEYEALYRTA